MDRVMQYTRPCKRRCMKIFVQECAIVYESKYYFQISHMNDV